MVSLLASIISSKAQIPLCCFIVPLFVLLQTEVLNRGCRNDHIVILDITENHNQMWPIRPQSRSRCDHRDIKTLDVVTSIAVRDLFLKPREVGVLHQRHRV